MKIAVLDKDTLGEDIDLSPIYALGEVSEYPTTAAELVAQRLQGVNVAVLNKVKLHKGNLSGAKDLKLICVAATGFDNIDTEYCKEKGIALCNVPGYSTQSVAQVTLAMALYLVSHLGEYRNFVHTGAYSESGVANRLTPVYHDIASLRWGVVGGGSIGMKVADIASAIGAEVTVCRRKQEGKYTVSDIDTICKECDIISVHLPLSDSTQGILSRDRINSMKKTAIVINTARGAVADEEALAEAVLNNKIGGLGVDVYSVEPFPKEHPYTSILHLNNVCLTPHMAWGSKESRARCVSEIAMNIQAFFLGESRNRIV